MKGFYFTFALFLGLLGGQSASAQKKAANQPTVAYQFDEKLLLNPLNTKQFKSISYSQIKDGLFAKETTPAFEVYLSTFFLENATNTEYILTPLGFIAFEQGEVYFFTLQIPKTDTKKLMMGLRMKCEDTKLCEYSLDGFGKGVLLEYSLAFAPKDVSINVKSVSKKAVSFELLTETNQKSVATYTFDLEKFAKGNWKWLDMKFK
jgi:hypothetical protein